MIELEQSYALCQRLARRAASNFYFSFFLLPQKKRRAMWALYAYLRHVDDLADDISFDVPARKQALEVLREDLHVAMAGHTQNTILPALADTAVEYQIPLDYLTAVIDGVEMDLDGATFATFAELEAYCYRVASVVGLACIHIWGFRGPQAIAPARDCGLAFQLTNILRDLKEDAVRGRVYLPREDLAQFGYSENDLYNGVINDRFENLMRFEIARAQRFYDSARALEPRLDRGGRRVFHAMRATYRALLQKISRDPARVFRQRVRLSRWEKMQIAMESFFLRPVTLTPAEKIQAVSS